MSGSARIVWTFVGDPSRDSRLLRGVRALASLAPSTILALGAAPACPPPDGTDVRRIALVDPDSLRRSLTRAWRDTDSWADLSSVSLVVASDLYTLPLAARIARRHGAPLLYDARELYSAIAALHARPATQRFWSMLERWYMRRVDAVLTVNDAIAQILRGRFPRVPVHVIHNYPDQAYPHEADRLHRRLGLDPSTPIILSQGGLQEGRGALIAVRAFARMGEGVLVFLGTGTLAPQITAEASRLGCAGRVHVVEAVPSDELLAYTASATLSLVLIEPLGRSYELSLPNKLFESIAAGVPVLASDLPEIARVVRATGTGVVVAPDEEHVHMALVQLMAASELRASLRAACLLVRDRYRWDGEAERLRTLVSVMQADAGVHRVGRRREERSAQ